jgi:hypothetical protein
MLVFVALGNWFGAPEKFGAYQFPNAVVCVMRFMEG